MLTPSTSECPTCESRDVTLLPVKASHNAEYWFQCECCDHVFSTADRAYDHKMLDGMSKTLRISELSLNERSIVTALVEENWLTY